MLDELALLMVKTPPPISVDYSTEAEQSMVSIPHTRSACTTLLINYFFDSVTFQQCHNLYNELTWPEPSYLLTITLFLLYCNVGV